MRQVEQGKIFVFGSNLVGRHGKGAALHAAKYHGAEQGVGFGRTGNAYAIPIPTKDERLNILPRDMIEAYVKEFIDYARANPDTIFYLTPVGCGLAGYSRFTMRAMFRGCPPNVEWADTWEQEERTSSPF